jgi:hypothetical protein
MDQPVKPEPKKPYTPPKVTVYGTVRDLTLMKGIHGTKDGGVSFSHSKTNF